MAPSAENNPCGRTHRLPSRALFPDFPARPGQVQSGKPNDAEFVICYQTIDITYIRLAHGFAYLVAVIDG